VDPDTHALKTLIFHPQVLVRAGLKQVLAEEFRSIVFGEADTAAQALAQIGRHQWDVAILDADGTDSRKDRFYVLQQTVRRRPSLRVLALGSDADFGWVTRALQIGATGCVWKDVGRSELAKAFKNVVGGRACLDPMPAKMSPASSQISNGHAGLSARERKVLLAVAAGKRTGEIAAEWNLSAKTVSTYKRRLLDKLDLKSTADLVRYVITGRIA
jgi:two-component system, NarL family, invasion response regulator UvrY